MTGHRILLLCVLFSLVTAFGVADVFAAEDRSCQEAQKLLESKRKQLAEYLISLKKSQGEGDAAWLAVLNNKITDLLNEIVNLPELADCQRRGESAKNSAVQGMGPVKFDTSDHCSKTCPELKKLLVQLVRKTSSLRRREHSTFSELSDTEKQELQDATRDTRVVVEIMKARCGLASTPKHAKSGKRKQRNLRGLRPPP